MPNSSPIGCPCGERYQTRERIIKTFPRYEDQREILREADEHMELGTLLCTKDGLEALAKFIEYSGAFTKTGQKRGRQTLPGMDDHNNNEEDDRRWKGQREVQRECTDWLRERSERAKRK